MSPVVGRRPLSERPRDLVYFCFFVIHIPASLLIDAQALYPTFIVPAILQKLLQLYLNFSGDLLVASAFGYYTPDYAYVWFRTFLWLEILFQFPIFFLGARGLWNDSPSIYIPLLIYGASTTTTVLPCLATLLTIPTTTNLTSAAPAVTAVQRLILLSSYIPFLLVPLAITIDMAWRLSSMIDFGKYSRARAIHVKREE